MPYGGGYSGLSSKNNRLNQYKFIKNPKNGAILIEFAFAVPVLFSLIYYISDLATIKRWHSKLDFSLHCAANMFQNTQNITTTDFANITYASVIGMFGDPEHNIWPYIDPPIVISALCITGTTENKCKVNWFTWSDVSATKNICKTSTSSRPGAVASKFHLNNRINIGSIYSATQLDSNLIIGPGETKIILEISIFKKLSNKNYDRDYIKLFFARVSPAFIHEGEYATLMNHTIIFTPKPETFDPNNPPQ
mgnify:CR=1 FL=1